MRHIKPHDLIIIISSIQYYCNHNGVYGRRGEIRDLCADIRSSQQHSSSLFKSKQIALMVAPQLSTRDCMPCTHPQSVEQAQTEMRCSYRSPRDWGKLGSQIKWILSKYTTDRKVVYKTLRLCLSTQYIYIYTLLLDYR